MRKILLLGGAGFVGQRLANRFESSKFDFDIYDINDQVKDLKINKINLESEEFANIETDCNVIINLVAEHRDDVQPISRYDDVNVQGARNVCDLARRNQINTIIFTSSVAVYGFSEACIDETAPPNYFNDYGRTKWEAENIYRDWFNEDTKRRTLVIVRPTVIFGEGNRGNVFNLFKQIKSKRFVMIGNGANIKSMAYVENVAAFLQFSLGFKQGYHLYNYADKPDFKMDDLIILIRKFFFNEENVGMRVPVIAGVLIGIFADFLSAITRKKLPISAVRVRKFVGNTQFETKVKETGFKAPFNVNKALHRTMRHEFKDPR